MAEQVIKKEQIDYTVDTLITMIVTELANDLNQDYIQILEDFLVSKTGKELYNVDTNLWCNGPSYIADLYKEEKGLK